MTAKVKNVNTPLKPEARIDTIIEEESNHNSMSQRNSDSEFDFKKRTDSKSSTSDFHLISTERESMVKKEDKINEEEEQKDEEKNIIIDDTDSDYSN